MAAEACVVTVAMINYNYYSGSDKYKKKKKE
jgi:hypothetical protein